MPIQYITARRHELFRRIAIQSICSVMLLYGICAYAEQDLINEKLVLFQYDDKTVTARDLMCISKAEYIKNGIQLFSWDRPKALATELQFIGITGEVTDQDAVRHALAVRYERELAARTLLYIAKAVSDDLGRGEFHYERQVIDRIIAEQRNFDSDFNNRLRVIADAKSKDDYREEVTRMANKWGARFNDPERQLAIADMMYGTAVPQILLYLRQSVICPEWSRDLANQWVVDVSNFSYEIRYLHLPRESDQFLDEFLDHLVRHNVFVVSATDETVIKKIDEHLREIVTEDGVVAKESLKELNKISSELDSQVAVVHDLLDRDFIRGNLGYEKDPARQIRSFKISPAYARNLVKAHNLPLNAHEAVANEKAEDANLSGIVWAWIFPPVPGSSDYLRESLPTEGRFYLFLREEYLVPLIERSIARKFVIRDENAFPDASTVYSFIEGQNMKGLLFGWRADKIEPIRKSHIGKKDHE